MMITIIKEQGDQREYHNTLSNYQFWGQAPNDAIQKLLFLTLEHSGFSFPVHRCNIYHNIKLTCCR